MNAHALTIIAAGVFFLNALLTGVWKYLEMVRNDTGLAHPYVDIAHRTSLLYSFAALLLSVFADISQLPDPLELAASSLVLAYFAMAILSYMVQGALKRTDNQIRGAGFAVRAFMWSLIIGEIGGFLVLFYGVVESLLLG